MASGLGDVRGEFERRPRPSAGEGRGPFAVDEGRALEALDWLWGDSFEVAVRSGVWTARRRDGLGGEIETATPDELNQAMRADFMLKPVVPR